MAIFNSYVSHYQRVSDVIGAYRCPFSPSFSTHSGLHSLMQAVASMTLLSLSMGRVAQRRQGKVTGPQHITYMEKKKHINYENLHRSCVLTGGLCFMDWAPPNRHQTLHFGPKRNHAILMDSWLTGGTKKINHKAMQV